MGKVCFARIAIHFQFKDIACNVCMTFDKGYVVGTWSAGSFGNDSALDFVSRVTGAADLARAVKALGSTGNWIDSDLAAEAIAAADIVAALHGRVSADLPEGLSDTLSAYELPSHALVAAASKAVDHVRENSELADLWADSEVADWMGVIDDLLVRLDLGKPYVARINDGQQSDDAVVGFIGMACAFCGGGILETEAITLVVESDDDDIVWFRSTSYAHRACIVQNLKPPHFNADGTPHLEVLAQLRRQTIGS